MACHPSMKQDFEVKNLVFWIVSVHLYLAVPRGRYCLYVEAFGNRCQDITGDRIPHRSRQGGAYSGGTINFLPLLQGKLLNVCGNHQTLGHQVLKSSKIKYLFCGLGALLAK